MMNDSVIPTKPYLIRAIRDWSIDNGFTPQMLVDINIDGVNVPMMYAKDGQIVLNIHDKEVQSLSMENEWICFSARFNGISHKIDVPVDSVLAIYARENGQGLFFQQSEGDDSDPVDPKPALTPEKKSPGESVKKKSHLKLV